MGVNAKKFRETHICLVNPRRNRVYNFKKKKQEKYAHLWESTATKRKRMPTIGYLCEACRKFNNYEKLYLVNKIAMHEACGMKFYEKVSL